MVIQITTAGYDRTSICWKQYQYARKVLADPEFDRAYFAHIDEAPEGAAFDDPAVWAACNPSYGAIQQESFYVDQLTKQPEPSFRRFYLNQWTRSAESWLPSGAWEACRSTLEIPAGAAVFAAVDAALYHDSTAVTFCAEVDGRLVVRSKVWTGDQDVADVLAYLRDLADRYRLVRVPYDPRFFDLAARQLQDEGIPMLEVPQSPERMIPICGHAWELIVSKRIAHDGDPILEDHVLSAVQRPGERGWTLSKGRSKRLIDACIAMVLALWEASQPEAAPLEPWFDVT